eukprot:c22875_g1_i1 orf=90-1604(+)
MASKSSSISSSSSSNRRDQELWRRKVIKLAFLSRVFLLALMLLWRVLGRPYDTSALLNLPCLSSASSQHLLQPQGGGASLSFLSMLSQTLEKSIVWDGVYYVRIAECGYEYEQTFAFLPVFPLCIRFIANTVLSGLIPFVGYRATLGLSGFLFNNIAFVLSAILLHKVSFKVLKDERLAYQSTALFCLNPASIFYASIYSESLFSLLSFAGLWEFLSGSRWKSACLFAISGGVRSNGVLHGGFLLFHAMQESFKAFRQRRYKMAVQILCIVVFQTTIVFVPFVAYQTYGFLKLCVKETSKKESMYSRPWCNEKIPYMYGFIQSHYWDVGFLRYFQVKQLPNFLLASPTLFLAGWSIFFYVKHRPRLFFTLGLCSDSVVPIDEDKQHTFKLVGSPSAVSKDFVLRQRGQNRKEDRIAFRTVEEDISYNMDGTRGGYFSPLSIPFLVEMAFMALVACLIMHVQVATRFLSVCAPIYWFAAHQIHTHPSKQKLAYIIWGTFFFYVLL